MRGTEGAWAWQGGLKRKRFYVRVCLSIIYIPNTLLQKSQFEMVLVFIFRTCFPLITLNMTIDTVRASHLFNV